MWILILRTQIELYLLWTFKDHAKGDILEMWIYSICKQLKSYLLWTFIVDEQKINILEMWIYVRRLN